MDNKSTKMAAGAAHLLELEIVFYATAMLAALYGYASLRGAITAFIIALLITPLFAGILRNILGESPCEWLFCVELRSVNGRPEFKQYLEKRYGVAGGSLIFVQTHGNAFRKVTGVALLSGIFILFFI